MVVVVNATKDERCEYKCVIMLDDIKIDPSSHWVSMDLNNETFSAHPECDVFELRCKIGTATTYKYIHSHINELPTNDQVKRRQSPTERPDVHIIVLDSVSMAHVQRALPKTLHYIRNEFKAMAMPYLNKVGKNSNANALAFMFDAHSEILPESPWNSLNEDVQDQSRCKTLMADKNFIGFDFKRAGYRTMLNEDMSVNLFHEARCKGWGTTPADHYPRQFFMRIEGEGTKDPDYARLVFNENCEMNHHPTLHYLQDYLAKYRDQPKFSITWLTFLAHDDLDDLYAGDDLMLDFFRSRSEQLNNSYVFFMADHGATSGKVRASDQGLSETNNPFLFLSIPRHMRGNEDLINQLYTNSKQLITHYDIYATLLDLAMNYGHWDINTSFSDRFEDRNLTGSSLLRQLNQPRDCNSLMIPFQHCLCERPGRELDDLNMTVTIGNAAVRHMNLMLEEKKFDELCEKLYLNPEWPMTKLIEYDTPWPREEKRFFKLLFRVLPGNGVYEVFAKFDTYLEEIRLIVDTRPVGQPGSVSRINIY